MPWTDAARQASLNARRGSSTFSGRGSQLNTTRNGARIDSISQKYGGNLSAAHQTGIEGLKLRLEAAVKTKTDADTMARDRLQHAYEPFRQKLEADRQKVADINAKYDAHDTNPNAGVKDNPHLRKWLD